MRSRKIDKGFTLVEVIVVIGVIAILAAILTPYITKYIDDSRVAKAKNETQVIGAAVTNFYKDLGRWPNATNATTAPATNFGGLFTGTTQPTAALFGAATGWAAIGATNWNAIDTHLNTNGHTYTPITSTLEQKWNGPYATQLPLDPWGHPYLINATQFIVTTTPPTPVWVLSAGPNGVVNTNIAVGTTTPTLDDIGFRIR